MARGKPDYDVPDYAVAIVQNDFSVFSLVDSGFTFLDGKGRIIWFDNFKQGLQKWNIVGSLGGDTPAHNYFQTFSYGFYGAVTLNPNVNGGQCTMAFLQNISFTKRVGVEIYIFMVSNHGRFEVTLQQSPANDLAYTAKMYIEEGTGDVFITHAGGDTRVFDNPSNSYISNHWTNIKLVADYSTGKFYKLIVGGTEIDLSAYSMPSIVFGIKGRVSTNLSLTGKVAPNTGQVYVGGVLLSIDEP